MKNLKTQVLALVLIASVATGIIGVSILVLNANNSPGTENPIDDPGDSNIIPEIIYNVSSAPLNLVVSAASTAIELRWEKPLDDGGKDITGYNIYHSLSSGVETLATTITAGDAAVSFYYDSLFKSVGTNYYKVSAINFVGESELSNEASIVILPPDPSILSAQYTNLNRGVIALSWTLGSSIIKSDVYRGTTTTAPVIVASLGEGINTYIDIVSDGIYQYTVILSDVYGESPASNVVTVTVPIPNVFDLAWWQSFGFYIYGRDFRPTPVVREISFSRSSFTPLPTASGSGSSTKNENLLFQIYTITSVANLNEIIPGIDSTKCTVSSDYKYGVMYASNNGVWFLIMPYTTPTNPYPI